MLRETIKGVVVGDGAVGKSSLLITHAEGKFPLEYVPTCFDNFVRATKIDDVWYDVCFWDTGNFFPLSMLIWCLRFCVINNSWTERILSTSSPFLSTIQRLLDMFFCCFSSQF